MHYGSPHVLQSCDDAILSKTPAYLAMKEELRQRHAYGLQWYEDQRLQPPVMRQLHNSWNDDYPMQPFC